MISVPVLLTTLREMLHSRMRIVLAGFLFLSSVAPTLLTHHSGVAASGNGFLYALIFGAGLVGRPSSNGTLALLFSRPLKRSSYVMTRWLAAVAAAAGLAILANCLKSLESFGSVVMDWRALGVANLEDALAVAGTVAMLICFSSFIGGIGDVAVFVIFKWGSDFVEWLGRALSKPSLSWVGMHLAAWFPPKLNFTVVFGSTPLSWHGLVAYLSTVSLCLVAAIELLNWKEVSYGSSGG